MNAVTIAAALPRIQTENLEPPASLARPVPQRSSSRMSERTLPDPFRMYTSGDYKEPPSKTFWGKQLYTPAHQRVMDSLRAECSRLRTQVSDIRHRLGHYERMSQAKGDNLALARLEIQQKNAHINLLTEELAAANAALTEMDEALSHSKTKRLNRLSQLGGQDGAANLG